MWGASLVLFFNRETEAEGEAEEQATGAEVARAGLPLATILKNT